MSRVFFRTGVALASVLGLSVSTATFSADQPAKPVGHVSFETHSADFGVGYTWGEGKLVFGKHTYRFKVSGGNVAAVGYSSMKAEGEVYNLHHLHDFDGTYGTLAGEATLAKGRAGTLLQNSNGVRITLHSKTAGARLAAGVQGLNFKLKN